jgi:hypothetical protein
MIRNFFQYAQQEANAATSADGAAEHRVCFRDRVLVAHQPLFQEMAGRLRDRWRVHMLHRSQPHDDGDSTFNLNRWHLPLPPETVDRLHRNPGKSLCQRQQRLAQPRHMFFDRQPPGRSSGRKPNSFFHFARSVGWPNISLSMTRAVFPITD